MSSDVSRDELKETLLRVSRKVGSQSGLFTQAVAERLGLAGIDVDSLDVLLTEGRVTVGRLAELTGLTTGSATRMVDRLEQAGFVHRVADPTDRRRVLVEAVPGIDAKLHALHDSLRTAETALFDAYDDAQLQLIADFMEQVGAVLFEESVKLREPQAESADAGGSYAAPVGGVTSGRLIFLTGAPRITLTGDPRLDDLYRADFVGPVPRMRVRGGVVTVAYPKFGWFDWRAQVAGQFIDASAHWRKDFGEIVLNAGIPWAIEMRGGVSTWTADLRAIRLESFELKGGASAIELTLPAPVGVVPIRMIGGVNRVSIYRPVGAGVGLEIKGGIGEVTLDGESRKGFGHLSFESPGASDSADRYEIEITGGAAKLAISTR
jgi:DNA-binding MarR family transcriptional regulator